MVNDTRHDIQPVPDFTEQAVRQMLEDAVAEKQEAQAGYNNAISDVVTAKERYGDDHPRTWEAQDDRNDARERMHRSYERVKTLRDVLKVIRGE